MNDIETIIRHLRTLQQYKATVLEYSLAPAWSRGSGVTCEFHAKFGYLTTGTGKDTTLWTPSLVQLTTDECDVS